MVRGVFVDSSRSKRMTLKKAMERYLQEVSATKRPSTAKRDAISAEALLHELGDYALAQGITTRSVAIFAEIRGR